MGGDIGDQICAEPTLRYAFNQFKSWATFTLASENPEFFKHLPFSKVFNLKEVTPNWDNYLVFDTIVPPTHLTWEFFSHCVTNCVDFPTLCALRSTLPIKDKEIQMTPNSPKEEYAELINKKSVFIHPGKHWKSKTFPKDWWDTVLKLLITESITPIIIGGDADDNRGTVDIDTSGCVDLRNKLSWEDSIWLLQRATVLITNDSAPLHMAASYDPREPESTGHCWIGYVATCKHPDFITHWRKGQWSYHMQNLGKGGMWEITDHCPNKKEEVRVDEVGLEILKTWLPSPSEVLEFVKDKVK